MIINYCRPGREILFIILLFLVSFVKIAYSGTTVNIIPVGGLSIDDIDTVEIQNQVQDLADLNGPIISDSFALVNMAGYPIGKAYIGNFPHFEVGLSVGAGCTNMKYFDEDDPASDNGSFPGITLNPAVHFGLGLGNGLDVLAKFFYISKSLFDPSLEYDVVTLSDFKLYSIGGKLRYNYIRNKTIIPFIFNFGGLTFSLAGDFMYGNVKLLGEYDYDFEDVEIEVLGVPREMLVGFSGDYDSVIDWMIFAVTAQAIAYCDILYIFSIYSGFGLTGNIGYFKIGFDGDGGMVTDDPVYQAAMSTDSVGTLSFETQNRYDPAYIIPTYIIGVEINIYAVKLSFETMVNMRNRSDVNLQFGARMQM